MLETFHCPKCSALLTRSGEITIGEHCLPVFQCDDCLVDWEFDGTVEQIAYTFAVAPNGTPFDPASDSLPL
jgi:hypothetical protein